MIEDVPGVGKTVLAKSLARAAGCDFSRLQCTADLLPSDVTGITVWDQNAARFVFRPGPVFANLVLVDEINRASPKTQSALLECMEEGQVTVDGETRLLPRAVHDHRHPEPGGVRGHLPAPRGPARPLRRARRDRLPAAGGRGADAPRRGRARPARRRRAPSPTRPASWRPAPWWSACTPTPPSPATSWAWSPPPAATARAQLGGSPRAGLALLRAAKARALLERRGHALPEDVRALATTVLSHRIILTPDARARGATAADVVRGRARRGARPAVTSGRGPSGRALALVAAGAAALVASRGFGTPALAVLGVGLIALPVLVTVLVALAAAGLELHRTRSRLAAHARRRDGPSPCASPAAGPPPGSAWTACSRCAIDPGLCRASPAPAGVPEPRGGAWTLRARPRRPPPAPAGRDDRRPVRPGPAHPPRRRRRPRCWCCRPRRSSRA